MEECILLRATRLGATTGHTVAVTCGTSRSWQGPTRSQQHCQKGGFRQLNQCDVPSYTTVALKATNRPCMWPTAPQAAQNYSHIRGNASRPNTAALRSPQRSSCSGHGHETVNRVLHKVLIMFLRLSQTSISPTTLSIHSWDTSRKNIPRFICALTHCRRPMRCWRVTRRPAQAFVSGSGSLIASRLPTAWCRMLVSQVTNKQTSSDPLFLEPLDCNKENTHWTFGQWQWCPHN